MITNIGGYVSAIVTKKDKEGQEQSKHVADLNKNLLTNNGRDLFHAQCYTNTSAGTRGAGYIAVSTGTVDETTASTALQTEIAAGGLSRADATTKTHTAGTNSSTIEHTFTASATHTAVHKSAMFNAASGVTMTHVANFTADATLVSGDTLKVTWTLNLG